MTALTPKSLRETAEEAARRGGRVLAARFAGTRTVEFKGGIDLVTDADRASELEVLGFLRARHPDHALLAEESGAGGGPAGGYRWIVDPLDGTTNYAHRLPHFCVSVAVEKGGQLLAGAVYDPIRDELFCAGLGLGAHLNGAPLRASDQDSIDASLLCTGFPYDVRENPAAPVGLFTRLVRQARGVRRMGSAALDLAYVAAGRFDGFFEFSLKPWDIAAGALLVTEAGGAVGSIAPGPLDLERGHILACGRNLEPTLRRECEAFVQELGWSG